LLGLVAGLAIRLAGASGLVDMAWMLATLYGLLSLAGSIARDLARRRVGVDVIAVLAMAGALAVGEYLAGAIIAVMLSTGRFLEDYANNRARRELSALIERAPHVVHRYQDGALTSPRWKTTAR
jgi:cation transport ATPase